MSVNMSPEWEWEEYELWNLVKNATTFPKITIIISTYNRMEMLIRAIKSILNQSYQNFNIIIVGDNCPTLKDLSPTFTNDSRILAFNLVKNSNDGGATPKNYALSLIDDNNAWVTYLDDDNYYYKDHLLWYWYNIVKNPTATFGISSIVMEEYNIIFHEPKLYRVDTSCIIHKKLLVDKYGNWKSHKEAGYSHDWEFVSRWLVNPKEEYFATKKCTVWYNSNGVNNNCRVLYYWYKDQLF